MDPSTLLDVLARFAASTVRRVEPAEALQGLCHDLTGLLNVSGAGVMIEDPGGTLRFIAASDERVRTIEALQIETGEGPCVMAYERGEVVLIEDLTASTPFELFAEKALAEDMRAVMSFPMAVDGERIGAINLFRDRPGSLSPPERRAGQLIADLASGYLLSARDLDRTSELVRHLQTALGNRVVIEQAKGFIAASCGVGVDEAFEALRRYARSRRAKVGPLARAVVTGDLEPGAVVADGGG